MLPMPKSNAHADCTTETHVESEERRAGKEGGSRVVLIRDTAVVAEDSSSPNIAQHNRHLGPLPRDTSL